MDNCWLIPISMDNYEISVKNSIIGVNANKKKLLDKLEIGDKLSFYVSKETVDKSSKRLMLVKGIAEVVSDTFIDDKELWNAKNDMFPYRKSIKFLDTKRSFPIKDILENLSFYKPKSWAFRFVVGPVKLTNKDWKLITNKLG